VQLDLPAAEVSRQQPAPDWSNVGQNARVLIHLTAPAAGRSKVRFGVHALMARLFSTDRIGHPLQPYPSATALSRGAEVESRALTARFEARRSFLQALAIR